MVLPQLIFWTSNSHPGVEFLTPGVAFGDAMTAREKRVECVADSEGMRERDGR